MEVICHNPQAGAFRSESTKTLQLECVLQQGSAGTASVPFAQQMESAARAMFRPKLDYLAFLIQEFRRHAISALAIRVPASRYARA
jgi:hypothetical protein